MKQRPKGFVFAFSRKDNKPVKCFQVLSTEIDYSSARRIHAVNQQFNEDDKSDNDVLGEISDMDGSNDHEHADISFVIDDMPTDDDTSDIEDANHNNGDPLPLLMSSLDDDF